ncbi:MAG: NAD(P)H-dependent oxidoreductase subunit E, partial [Alphaproteobacteria bacterium]
TFYSMFNLAPVGKHLVQVCRTTPCWLRGSDDLTDACRTHLGVELGEISDDGEFTVVEVECLGACVNAPMAQINDHYYEDLTAERMTAVLDALRAGDDVAIGTQEPQRQFSAPIGGPTTLVATGEG